ncbi:3-dehydroquinate synthase [Candidatus Daviesbacteria bacterium]|nr:3-dehydroquinate synthase [Candidatus Daviesbacteria bacterium]
MKNSRILDSYNILVGENILSKLPQLISLDKYSNIFLILDHGVEKNWSKKIHSAFPNCNNIILKSGEKAKTIDTVQKVWQKLLLGKHDRKTLVVNIGGGVIGDMGGFAASTFMRGLDFIQIPTTITAQVDSSVGGKTGINFAGIKNLIGTFNQPVAVLCDIDFLSSLPSREFISGFAEIIKHGLIADKKYFNFVTSKKPRDFSNKELTDIIETSISIKANIVNNDEKEKALRKLLHFGHTLGHAIESLSQETKNPLLHGEAIAIGMMMEGQLSKLLGLLSDKDYQVLKNAFSNAGLPTTSPALSTKKILKKIQSDKKNEKGIINWTLLQTIGKAIINQPVDEKIARQVL